MEKCQWCGALDHNAKCPLVKAIEFFENGGTKRVEFIVPQDFLPVVAPDKRRTLPILDGYPI